MGASLLAMAVSHPTLLVTDTPLSRASSLPQGKWWFQEPVTSGRFCTARHRPHRSAHTNTHPAPAEHRECAC
ncbi:hypothetical protein DJ564_15490 [Pseudomonas sp. 31-12]|nr:hypothetical protein DJ564_15490 [Pseudomonas sp. 31-12]